MRLRYKAIDPDGKVIRGSVESNDMSGAAAYLRQRGLTPININQEKKTDFMRKLPFAKKVSNKDLVLFTRQISSMLTSGLTLIKSLEIIKDQTPNATLREMLGGILLDLQEGTPFSDAIAKFPEVFPSIYVSLIKAGEASGLLDQIFLRLANNLERQQKLKNKVKSALTYPIVVITLMVVVMLLMLIFVIPQLSKLYSSLNVELPLMTRITLFLSELIGKIWPLIIIMVFLAYYGFERWKKSPKGKEIWDKFTLRLPIFGKIIKQTILAEFSRTFGLLVGTGTLVVDALNQSANVAGNYVYKTAIEDIANRVEKGVPLGEAMGYHSIFPSILIQLVKVGEETGKVDENLMKASEYFEEEVDQSVKSLTTAMEPLIMIILGVGVGFLVFSVISPIYNLLSSISG